MIIQSASYPIRAVSRMTGLSEQLIRTWEARYDAVRPRRTRSGARRYSEREVRRLRLLVRGTEAGFRIGELAPLDERQLEARLSAPALEPAPRLEPFLEAAQRIDAPALERLLALQLSALGPREFATRVARPLLVEIGNRWRSGTLCVAGEHLISSALVGLMRASLMHAGGAVPGGPRVVFACLQGERHEIGLLSAAVCAHHAGAVPIYLGADLPPREIALAVRESGALALALVASVLRAREVRAQLVELRAALGPGLRIWLGGSSLELRASLAVPLESLESLEREIETLRLEAAAR